MCTWKQIGSKIVISKTDTWRMCVLLSHRAQRMALVPFLMWFTHFHRSALYKLGENVWGFLRHFFKVVAFKEVTPCEKLDHHFQFSDASIHLRNASIWLSYIFNRALMCQVSISYIGVIVSAGVFYCYNPHQFLSGITGEKRENTSHCFLVFNKDNSGIGCSSFY